MSRKELKIHSRTHESIPLVSSTNFVLQRDPNAQRMDSCISLLYDLPVWTPLAFQTTFEFRSSSIKRNTRIYIRET